MKPCKPSTSIPGAAGAAINFQDFTITRLPDFKIPWLDAHYLLLTHSALNRAKVIFSYGPFAPFS